MTFIVSCSPPRTFEKCEILCKGEPILPNDTFTWNNQLFKVPLFVPSLTNCGIIKVEYFFRVVLLISGSIFHLHTDLPIVIGNVPYQDPNN